MLVRESLEYLPERGLSWYTVLSIEGDGMNWTGLGTRGVGSGDISCGGVTGLICGSRCPQFSWRLRLSGWLPGLLKRE